MMIIPALTGLALSTSAGADSLPVTKPITVAMFCTQSSEQISGLTKVCYYRCGKSEGAMTAATMSPARAGPRAGG